MVVGYSAVSVLAWVCAHVTGFNCEAWDLAFSHIKQRNEIPSRSYAVIGLEAPNLYVKKNRLQRLPLANPLAVRHGRAPEEKAPLFTAPGFLNVTRAVTRAGTGCSHPRHQCSKSPTPAAVPAAMAGFERRTLGVPCARSRGWRPDAGRLHGSAACREHQAWPSTMTLIEHLNAYEV